MRITKKVLSLILAFCMAFSVFSVAVAAEESVPVAEAAASTGLRVTKADGSPLDATLAPGDVVRCYIGWQTNYNWRTISNIVYYDTTVFVPCYPSGDSFVEQTARLTGKGIEVSSGGVFHPMTSADFDEIPAAGVIFENVGEILSGQINQPIAVNTISGYFPPEMRVMNEATGKPTTTLLDKYANYNFVQASVSTSTQAGTAEGFILDEYQEYVYFYLKVKDDAALTDEAGLFMHPGSTKGVASYPGEGNYGGGKTYCSYMPSEEIVSATNLSRNTCTVTTGETYYTVSNGAPAQTYTVDFDLNGGTGTAPASVTGEAGKAVTLPTTVEATKSGYTFIGWNTSAAATTALSSYSIPENGATLYAVWQKNPTYTVDFDLNGGTGTAPASVTGEAGTAVTLYTTVNAVKTGYTFIGWAESTDATTTISSYTISGNATLYAVWQQNPTYTVDFDLNGGTGTAPASVTGEAGTSVTLPATVNANREGFTFKGWNTSATATEPLSSYTIPVNGATLYAVWTSNPTYTVAFDLNGATGTVPASVTGEVGDPVALPATVEASKEGCEFAGWGTSASSTYALQSYTIPSGGSTLYAIWTAKEYKLTFVVDGENYLVKNYKYGATIDVNPAVPEKEGYSGVWNPDVLPDTMPAQDYTVIAVYTANKYTIYYKVGNDVTPQEVTYGQVVTIMNVPAQPGMTGSWSWADITGKPVSAPTTMPAYDLYATAQYEAVPVAYKIETYKMDTTGTYKLDDTQSKTAPANSDVSVTAPAADTGFTYEPSISTVSGNVKTTDNSLTLKLYYSRNQYVFNYVVEGQDYTTQTYYYDAEFAFPNAPTLESPKTFLGWTLNGTDFTAPIKVGAYDSPVTLVAKIDDGTVKYADYTALYAFLESESINPRTIGFQSFFPLLPASAGSYLERAAEEIVHYKEPAKTAITNALSFRTDCTEDEQAIVDGYLATLKNVFNTYIWPNKVNEEFDCNVRDPFGNTGTETAYRNPYTYEYYAENYAAELNIVQKEVTDDGTYVFDVVLNSNYPVAFFGFPILINADKYDIGTVPGTSSSYTTPNTDFFTQPGGFNEFYGYAQDGTSTMFRQHATATATNKDKYGNIYPEGPGWSAYDDLTFRNKYSIDFLVMGITQSSKSAPLAMSYDNLVIATFAIKLKAGQEFDKNDTFMVGDYFIGNQKTGDLGVSRTLYQVAKSKNSQISGPENCDAPMSTLTTTVQWLAEPETYTVSFDLNGGVATSLPEELKGTEGTIVTLPDITATKDHYDFIGWAESADATTALATDYEITGDVTLYAVWAPKTYHYTVNNYFMGTDGQYSGSTENIEEADYGTEIDLSNKEYATFTLDNDQNNSLVGTVDGDYTLTLVAYYIRNKYDINYVVDGQTIETASVFYGAAVEPIAVPKDQQGATGVWVWTKTADNSQTIEPTTMPAYGLTATADYTGGYTTYTVQTYTQNSDGSYPETPDIDTVPGVVGDTADATPKNIPTGFQVSQNSTLTGVISVEEPLVLTVYLERETHTVTYYVGGTVYGEPQSYRYGASIDVVAVPKDDAGNDGVWVWSTADGKAPTSMLTEDITATAQYPAKVIPSVYMMDVIGNYGDPTQGTPVYGNVGETVTVTVKDEDIPTGFELDTYSSVLTSKVLDNEGNTETPLAIYFARKSYTITYKAGDVETVKTYLFEARTEPAPDVPAVEGNTGSWDKETPTNMPAENLVINAVYGVNDYTITYKAGDVEIVKTYKYGADTEAAPAVPTLTGHSGVWDTETPTTMPAQNLVINAVYTPNTYTITYKAEGAQDIVRSYKFGQNTDPAPAVPTKEGFAGSWNKNTPDTMPAENLVIEAIYSENSYTVTYYVDGEVYKEESYIYGAAIAAAPNIPDKLGYSAAWEGETYEQMPAKNLEFTAVYTLKDFTITYVIGETEIVKTYKYGADTEDAPEIPEVEGKTGAWDKETPAQMPAENLVITAIYAENIYTITYVVNGQNYKEERYAFGADVTVIAVPRDANGNDGVWAWSTTDGAAPATMPADNLTATAKYPAKVIPAVYTMDVDGTYGDAKNGTPVYGNVGETVTATFEVPEGFELDTQKSVTSSIVVEEDGTTETALVIYLARKSYTITYKAEGSPDIVKTYLYGALTETPDVPTVDGKEGVWDAETPITMPAENLVINAVYSAKDYTITYRADDFELVKTYKFGADTEPAPDVPAVDGKTGVWDTETPAQMPAQNLVITATYTPNDYTITYVISDTNQIVKTYKFEAPTEAAPAIPEVTGYVGSWDAETPSKMPAQNLVINAVYEKAKFTITYIVDGNVFDSRTYKFEDPTDPAPDVPEKDHYTGSWNAETPAQMPAENLIIRAVYVERDYTITYVVDGQDYLVKTYKFGADTEAAPAVPEKEGYDGVWDSSTPAQMPAENLVITAKYTLKDSGSKVWSANYDGKLLVIEADKDALKVQAAIFVDGEWFTWTYTRDDATFSASETDTREIWTISGVKLPNGNYTARARYDEIWTDEDHSVGFTVNYVEELIPMSIVSVTPAEKYDGLDEKEIKVVTVGGPDKIQVRQFVGKETYTWTYNRGASDVTIKTLDDKGTEEWTINTYLEEGAFSMYAKAYEKWDYIEPLDFTIKYWVPSEEFGITSAEAVEGEEDTYKVVVFGGVDKIQFVSEDGSYTFSENNPNVTVVIDPEDPAIATWTIKAFIVDGTYQINLKRYSDWLTATDETVTLVVKNAE